IDLPDLVAKHTSGVAVCQYNICSVKGLINFPIAKIFYWLPSETGGKAKILIILIGKHSGGCFSDNVTHI
ncbi:hypothetical protein, partial [uncultured Parabacteroides sp.]|uniref:hypothetical protein n=1 Tax=uncultured Parabacteroides sp. TaxID=512312 RepID=UPI0025F3B7F8